MVAAQAAQLEALSAEVMRLRAAVIIRDTRLAWAQDALAQWQAAQPGLPRRQSMARHIGVLAERITALSRECLRWKLAASAPVASSQAPAAPQGAHPCKEVAVEEDAPAISDVVLHTSLAAADWVICQTGCISHDQYWRVQDHCRRTGKTCILMDQPRLRSLCSRRPSWCCTGGMPKSVRRLTRCSKCSIAQTNNALIAINNVANR